MARFTLNWGAIDITKDVMSYKRTSAICEGTKSISIEMIDNSRGIGTWDVLTLWEDGNKVGKFFVLDIKETHVGSLSVSGQDSSLKLARNFEERTWSPGYVSTSKYWICLWLDRAGVSYNFTVSGNGATLNKNLTFGMDTTWNLIVPLLQQSGWYMIFDSEDVLQIGELDVDTSSVSESMDETDIIAIAYTKNDSTARNRVVVWGGMDISTDTWITGVAESEADWQIDNSDDRSVVVSSNSIRNYSSAYSIANRLLNESISMSKEKILTVTGYRNRVVGDYISVSSRVYSGTGLITDLNVSADRVGGYSTEITLDRRCPRLFAYFSYSGYVYAGTVGGGVYRKLLEGSTWSTYNSGLTNLDIKDLYIKDGVFACVTGDGYAYKSTIATGYWTKLSHGQLTDEDENIYEEAEVKATNCTIDNTGTIIVSYNLQGNIALAWIAHYNVYGVRARAVQIKVGQRIELPISDMDNTGENSILGVLYTIPITDTTQVKGEGSSSIQKATITSFTNSYGIFNTHEFLTPETVLTRTFNRYNSVHWNQYIYTLAYNNIAEFNLGTGAVRYCTHSTTLSLGNSINAIAILSEGVLVGKVLDTTNTVRIKKWDFSVEPPVETTLATFSGYNYAVYNHGIYSYEGTVAVVWCDVTNTTAGGGARPGLLTSQFLINDTYVTFITESGVSTTGPIQGNYYTAFPYRTRFLAALGEISSATVAGILRSEYYDNSGDYGNGRQREIGIQGLTISLAGRTASAAPRNESEPRKEGPGVWRDQTTWPSNPNAGMGVFTSPPWLHYQGNRTSYPTNSLIANGPISMLKDYDGNPYSVNWDFHVVAGNPGGVPGDFWTAGLLHSWKSGTGYYYSPTQSLIALEGTFPVSENIPSIHSYDLSDRDGSVVYYDGTLASGIVMKGTDYTKQFVAAHAPSEIRLVGNYIFTDTDIYYSPAALISGVVITGSITTETLGSLILRDNNVDEIDDAFTVVISGVRGRAGIEISRAAPIVVHTKASDPESAYVFTSFDVGETWNTLGTDFRLPVVDTRVYFAEGETGIFDGYKIALTSDDSSLRSLASTLDAEAEIIFSGAIVTSGSQPVHRLETSNGVKSYFFASTSGAPSQFFQKNTGSSTFTEQSTGLPNNNIRIIRLDDRIA